MIFSCKFNSRVFKLAGRHGILAGKRTLDGGLDAAGRDQLLLKRRLNRAGPAAKDIEADR